MIDRRAAFRTQRAEVLAFCDSLGPADWRMNSRAQGWSIADVVAHMGSGCHALFTPAALTMMRGNDIEQANDRLVALRRDRAPAQILGEYRRWSRALGAVIPVMARGSGVRVPLSELGSFPMPLLVSALVFDQYTHLHHDMAPALGRVADVPDANRMASVLEWMMAVLANQLAAARPPWLDRPLSVTLSGAGGGTWTVGPGGSVTAGRNGAAAAEIRGVAVQFPEWGTRRAGWRDCDVEVSGDGGYATEFLDAMNIV